MSLHDKIMNLQAPGYAGLLAAPAYAAEIGHRDARHAAAELALEADAALEALRKDAERYRWLRDNPWPSPVESVVVRHANAAWDATIDAAMKEQPCASS